MTLERPPDLLATAASSAISSTTFKSDHLSVNELLRD